MISEETRKLAEETFDYIERSEASGNSYEANLPIGVPSVFADGAVNPTPEHTPGYCVACEGFDFPGPVPGVSMALAEHTARTIDAILGA